MAAPSILIAGIGNVFLGDDAFGIEVVRRLTSRPRQEGVRVVDFGIRGLDLAWAIGDGYDGVVLVDALPRGAAPGTVSVLEVTPETDPGDSCVESREPGVPSEEQTGPGALKRHDATFDTARIEPHRLDPASVIRLVRAWGAELPPLYVVGCEPLTFLADDLNSLSEPVAAAVDEAVDVVDRLVDRLQTRDALTR